MPDELNEVNFQQNPSAKMQHEPWTLHSLHTVCVFFRLKVIVLLVSYGRWEPCVTFYQNSCFVYRKNALPSQSMWCNWNILFFFFCKSWKEFTFYQIHFHVAYFAESSHHLTISSSSTCLFFCLQPNNGKN